MFVVVLFLYSPNLQLKVNDKPSISRLLDNTGLCDKAGWQAVRSSFVYHRTKTATSERMGAKLSSTRCQLSRGWAEQFCCAIYLIVVMIG